MKIGLLIFSFLFIWTEIEIDLVQAREDGDEEDGDEEDRDSK